MKKSVVVYFAHLALEHSVINRTLIKAIRGIPGLNFRNLLDLYPDFFIDIEVEQNILRGADLIVFQSPIYWYSTPAIFKHFIDTVLLRGFAYGEGGTDLKNKDFLLAVSTGAQREEYHINGIHRYAFDELIRPLEQTARFCGMNFLPPFILHGGHDLPQDSISDHAASYRLLLENYISNKPTT
ncbi:MAG: NAD(P)H-dependent oxidoreductase [Thiohalomonadales bacterium]